MGLPAQVQKQLDEADALQARLAVVPQASEDDAPTEPAEDQSQETQPTPSEPVAPDNSASKDGRDEFGLLEQRYKSLQGMWQSAESRLRQSQAQVAELTQRLEELSTKVEQQSQAPQPETSALVTDKDTEAFGSDLIDLARRISREEFGTREKQLLGQISKLEQQLSAASQQVGAVVDSQVQTAQERFYSALDGALPDWEALQATAEGQQWLVTRIPGTQATWNDALQDAARTFNAGRALEVFEAFLTQHPRLDKRKKAQPQQDTRPELQRQVAPSRAATAASTPSGKRTYSARDYTTEMDRVVQLNKQRKYDEAAALETELGTALAEGRVTP